MHTDKVKKITDGCH